MYRIDKNGELIFSANGDTNLRLGYCQITSTDQYCHKCNQKKIWLYQPCKWANDWYVCASCFNDEQIIHKSHGKIYTCQLNS